MNTDESALTVTEIEVEITAWGSALSQLVAGSGLSEPVLIDAARKGAVWLKPVKAHKLRRIRQLEDNVSVGDTLYLNFNASVLAQTPLVPRLISDEVNYSIWCKPAGMLSQGSKWSDHCTITETVAIQHGKPAYLVHRLDKAASGLIVIAHTRNALKKLTALFAGRQVEKQYRVQVHGQMSASLPIRIDADVQGKNAISNVLEIQYNKKSNTSNLKVAIETGRKHQIREHLNGAGFPVVGDRLFDREREHEHDLRLAATCLVFQCPFTEKTKKFELSEDELDWLN